MLAICLTGLFVGCCVLLTQAAKIRRSLGATDRLVSHFIVLKIALTTGLPNILAFAFVLIPDDTVMKQVFDVLYSIVYGLQGALLCVSFVTSRKVWDKLKIHVFKTTTVTKATTSSRVESSSRE